MGSCPLHFSLLNVRLLLSHLNTSLMRLIITCNAVGVNNTPRAHLTQMPVIIQDNQRCVNETKQLVASRPAAGELPRALRLPTRRAANSNRCVECCCGSNFPLSDAAGGSDP